MDNISVSVVSSASWHESEVLLFNPGHLLHDPLAAFAPPNHQGCHEQSDQDGHNDEGTEDPVGRVPEKPSRHGAVVEVLLVNSDEEFVHQPVGPVAVQPLRHQVCAVRQLAVEFDCVLPATPVSLVQALHVQLELRQAQLFNEVFIVGLTAQH